MLVLMAINSWPPAGSGRNAEVDFRGEKRSNDTHISTSDPDAMLYRKGAGMEAKLQRPGPAGEARRSFCGTRPTSQLATFETDVNLDPQTARPEHPVRSRQLEGFLESTG